MPFLFTFSISLVLSQNNMQPIFPPIGNHWFIIVTNWKSWSCVNCLTWRDNLSWNESYINKRLLLCHSGGITVLTIDICRVLMSSRLCIGLLNEASTKLSKLTTHWHPPHVEWRNIQSGPNGSSSEFGCWPFFLWSFFSCIHPSIRLFFQTASNPDVLYVQAKVFGFIQPGINTQKEH